MLEFLLEWDQKLLIWINNLGSETFDSFWLFTTEIEHWTLLYMLFFLGFFYYHKTKRGSVYAIFLLITFIVAFLITYLVKEQVARNRPNNVVELASLIRVLQHPTNFSFFSGHAASSFSIVCFVVLVLKNHTKWIYLAYIWPILFVLSRLFLGVHYPSDIIVGALVGCLIGYFIFYCTQITLKNVKL